MNTKDEKKEKPQTKKEELLERLLVLRAGLSLIAVKNDEIEAKKVKAEKETKFIANAKESLRKIQEKPLLQGYELTPIKNRQDKIRENEERIKKNEETLQKKPKEVQWNWQFGKMIFFFLSIFCLCLAFVGIYWFVLSLITDMGGVKGLGKVSRWMTKSKGPIRWIQHLYYIVDKRACEMYDPNAFNYDPNAANASIFTKSEGVFYILTVLLPLVVGIVGLVLGIKFAGKFFREFKIRSIVQVKDNTYLFESVRSENKRLRISNEKLKREIETIKQQTKGMDEEAYFTAEYGKRERLLRHQREYEVEQREKDLEKLHEEINERIKWVKAYYEDLIAMNKEFLDNRDWDKVDYLIYLIETNRAESIRDGLNLVDTQIWQNDMRRSMSEVKEIGRKLVVTMQQSANVLYGTMARGFSAMRQEIIKGRLENAKSNRLILESNYRQEELQSMALEMQRAAIEKQEATAKELVRIANSMQTIATW